MVVLLTDENSEESDKAKRYSRKTIPTHEKILPFFISTYKQCVKVLNRIPATGVDLGIPASHFRTLDRGSNAQTPLLVACICFGQTEKSNLQKGRSLAVVCLYLARGLISGAGETHHTHTHTRAATGERKSTNCRCIM